MSRRQIVLAGVSSKINGLQWESDSLLRIGRQENLEVVLADASVARRHAEVLATRQGWVLRDLGSGSSTSLNGVRIVERERRLALHDTVQIGNLSLQVAALDEASAGGTQPGGLSSAGPAPETKIKTTGNYVKVQAISRHSWEKALEVVALDAQRHPQQSQHLNTLLRAGYHLCHIESLDELLESILADAVAALDAQRAAIVLVDEATGQLQLRKVAVARQNMSVKRFYSKTLADRSFQQGQSMLCQDVRGDADLNAAFSVTQGTMSSIVCAVLRSPRKRLGVLHLDRGPLQEPFTQEEFYLADAIAASVSVGIESAQLVEQERERVIQTVTALARTVELRDAYTANHTNRVTDYAMLIGDALRVTSAERHQLQVGTPLHDIGKIGIPDHILRKPGPLTQDEFEEMKSHTTKGAAILETIPSLRPMITIARHHHERFDGKGYPDGLAGERISRVARVVAVADAFDAMTSDRPYRRALPSDLAFAEVLNKAGAHFDPDCAKAFVSVRSRIEEMIRRDRSLQRFQAVDPAAYLGENLGGSMACISLP